MIMSYKRTSLGFLKLILLIIILIVAIIVLLHINGESEKSSERKVMPSLKAYFYDYLSNEIKSPKDEVSDGCLISRENIVKQFRSLVRHQEDEPANYLETCVLPRNILDDERFHVMKERVKSVRRVCQKDPPFELTTPVKSLAYYYDKTHNILMCKNAQAGSSSIITYLNVLHMFSVMKNYSEQLYSEQLISYEDHFLLLREYSLPATTPKDLRDWSREHNLAIAVVRHPFKRALSCYMNKVEHGRHYPKRMPELHDQMIQFSTMSPDKVRAKMNELLPGDQRKSLKCPQSVKPPQILDEDHVKIPTFRGFILAITESIFKCQRDLDCLQDIEIHYAQQGLRCRTCEIEFDLIVKLESLEEDTLFMEKLLKLPPLYNLHLAVLSKREKEIKRNTEASTDNNSTEEGIPKYRANVSYMERSYADYMSELLDDEMDLLYTAYFSDFAAFSYDPCADL